MDCERCGQYCGEDYHDDGYEYLCDDCFYGERDMRERNVTWTLERGTVRDCNSYGVEIETEFEDHCPFEIFAYHSGRGADHRFFAGWRSEDDCSLSRGVEVISPPFYEAWGIAEIAATFQILRDHDAQMRRSCGQHTSVMVGAREDQTKAVRVTAALEDALMAATGSWARYSGQNSYSPSVKRGTNTRFLEDDFAYGGGNANARGDGRIEFRYPPGTLSTSQMAMNIGMCQLIVKKGIELSMNDAGDLAREAISIISNHGGANVDMYGYQRTPSFEATHELVKYGMSLLAEWGWSANGPFTGLPYDPDDTPRYTTDDHGTHSVRLPGRNRINARIIRQVNNFYGRYCRNNQREDEATDMAEEALNVLSTESALLS